MMGIALFAKIKTALLVLLAASFVHLGCLQSPRVDCGNGLSCVAPDTCASDLVDPNRKVCVSAQALAQCEGQRVNQPCVDAGQEIQESTCLETDAGLVCITSVCGDSLITGKEICDDGNRANNDGCSSDCISDETCGNGVIDGIKGERIARPKRRWMFVVVRSRSRQMDQHYANSATTVG
jgi:cysteine-rich repeat protein